LDRRLGPSHRIVASDRRIGSSHRTGASDRRIAAWLNFIRAVGRCAPPQISVLSSARNRPPQASLDGMVRRDALAMQWNAALHAG
jgi:hypothetical protein